MEAHLQAWEYETNETNSQGEVFPMGSMEEMLRNRGAAGWELVAVVPLSVKHVFIWKRPVGPTPVERRLRAG